jgi:hypothetical protein
MAKQTRSIVYELRSLNVAAGVDAVAPFRMVGELVTVQVIDAPADLVRVMGSVDGGTFALLTNDTAGGIAPINNVGAGLYKVRERPMWIRVGVNQDANAPRTFRVLLLVHEHD